jgi:hypothetical protein
MTPAGPAVAAWVSVQQRNGLNTFSRRKGRLLLWSFYLALLSGGVSCQPTHLWQSSSVIDIRNWAALLATAKGVMRGTLYFDVKTGIPSLRVNENEAYSLDFDGGGKRVPVSELSRVRSLGSSCVIVTVSGEIRGGWTAVSCDGTYLGVRPDTGVWEHVARIVSKYRDEHAAPDSSRWSADVIMNLIEVNVEKYVTEKGRDPGVLLRLCAGYSSNRVALGILDWLSEKRNYNYASREFPPVVVPWIGGYIGFSNARQALVAAVERALEIKGYTLTSYCVGSGGEEGARGLGCVAAVMRAEN